MAYAVGTDPRELVNICMSQIGDIAAGAYPLGFIYVSDALANELDHILHLLVHATGIDHWVGSLGIALCVTDQELYDQPAVAIMLTTIDKQDFKVFSSMEQAAESVNRAWVQKAAPCVGIIHGDVTNPASPEIIAGLSVTTGLHQSNFIGGLTSSQKHQYQIADGIVEGGVSGVLIAGRAGISVDHTQGCTPLDGNYTITTCRQNVIDTLDNRPAVDVMKDAVGEVLARDFSRLGDYIFAGLPIANSFLEHSAVQDYLVRNLIGIDVTNGAIAIGDIVAEGDPFIFCRRDGNSAIKDMRAMLKRIKSKIGDVIPSGGLYFTCHGRGRHQFGEHSEEMKMISEYLGSFPLIGFQANGEIFDSRIYGYTGVLVVFLG